MEERDQADLHEVVGRNPGNRPRRPQDRYIQDVADRFTSLLVDASVQPMQLHEIHDDSDLAEICMIIPRNMRLLM